MRPDQQFLQNVLVHQNILFALLGNHIRLVWLDMYIFSIIGTETEWFTLVWANARCVSFFKLVNAFFNFYY